jgi:hypothetical protein
MSAIGLRRMVGLGQPLPDGSHHRAEYTTRETVVLLIAGVTVMCGLIHIGAAVDHFHEFPLYTLGFVVLALAQFAWAAMLLSRPSPRVLLFGCAFNLGVVALWVASRTIGVPIAPRAWVPEVVGVADLVETAAEIVIVIAALIVVCAPRLAFARRVTGWLVPVLLIVLFLGVLYGVGAHAG